MMTANKKKLMKYIAGFLASLILSVVCMAVLWSVGSYAAMTEQPPTTTAEIETTLPYDEPLRDDPDAEESILDLLDVNDNNGTLDLVILITILTLAPSILLMFTCFTRIIIVFSLLRNAMGIQTVPPNQVLIGLAFFITMFVMAPVFSEINEIAYVPYKNGEMTTLEACTAASEPLKEFMLMQTKEETLEFFCDLSGDEFVTDEAAMELPLTTVVPAFILSEINTAFTIGFLLFIPFLVIDVVVSSLLMSMGMIMLPPATIAMPFKILMFVLVDGWQLLIGALVTGFYV